MRPSFPEVIDNTLLSAFRSCPQLAYQAYFEHWKSRSPNVHLHAGAAFAAGLEAARRAYYEGDEPLYVAEAVGMRRLLEAYGDFTPPEDSPKSAARMVAALEYYFDIWPLDSDSAKPKRMPSGRYAIEFSFAEPLSVQHPETRNPLIYCGRSDMIVELNGGLFVEDDKTTSQLGSSWANQWDLRSQFDGYVWAAMRAGIKVDGVLVRGVAVQKTQFKHAQYITYRTKWELDRWEHQTIRDINRMIECWKSGYWDYNLGESCAAYGGCQFRQVCKSPQESRHEWLNLYFERRRWDPIHRVEHHLQEYSQ